MVAWAFNVIPTIAAAVHYVQQRQDKLTLQPSAIVVTARSCEALSCEK